MGIALWSKFIERLRRWYRGEYVPPPRNRPGELVFISPGHYRRSRSARILRAIIDFHRRHRKDLVLVSYAALVGALITALLS